MHRDQGDVDGTPLVFGDPPELQSRSVQQDLRWRLLPCRPHGVEALAAVVLHSQLVHLQTKAMELHVLSNRLLRCALAHPC